jgi:hypothetical protein
MKLVSQPRASRRALKQTTILLDLWMKHTIFLHDTDDDNFGIFLCFCITCSGPAAQSWTHAAPRHPYYLTYLHFTITLAFKGGDIPIRGEGKALGVHGVYCWVFFTSMGRLDTDFRVALF